MISINNQCIGCGMCQSIIDTVFKVEGIPAKVIRQPKTPEEEKLCEQAIESCPTHAILNDANMKMAA
ncbi:MAG: hypothetical protein ACD_80C00012G0020 [uncultured bacterium (gcode 4)]|uniref:Ferredoxin n=1 Tax=uncultured bacterium (gcode 4) TaxID=1234023 RepID=K1YJV5_9BACT|nr:MAG: hypothetical protein ACD_80C00012G0020 [uncultured bacterium (gcode 4)]HBB04841.1 ferredoxin [Candidatus Gracilibacteria bacterium]